jgi:hypothetical protein
MAEDKKPTLDERLEAMAMNLEDASATIEGVRGDVNLQVLSQSISFHQMDRMLTIIEKLIYIVQNFDSRITRLEKRLEE